MGTLGGSPSPPATGSERRSPSSPTRFLWEPWEGPHAPPRRARSGEAPHPRPRQDRSGDAPPPPRDFYGHPGAVPKPPRDGLGAAKPLLPHVILWEPWERPHAPPRRAPSGEAPPPPRDFYGNLGGSPSP